MAEQNVFGLSTIGQIAVTVSDLEAAIAFYRDKLGLPFLFSAPPGLAFFNCGGLRLMLSVPEENSSVAGGTVLYFKVADINQAYDTLRERGVPFEDAPHLIARMTDHDLWMAFLRDPDQHLIGIMAEILHQDTN